jgi:alpha-tubulin suppressor-like RCC1 family protein
LRATLPTVVAGGLHFLTISAGFLHTCAVALDGAAYCWGANYEGQLGDGTAGATANAVTPRKVAFGSPFAALDAGFEHTCGLTAGGVAYCWGSDVYGEVGDGFIYRPGVSGQPRLTATAVVGGHRFASLTAGGGSCHGKTCGIATDGTTWCWGRSYKTLRLDSIPTALSGGQAFARLAIGGTAVCGTTTSGALYCWGEGYSGQVGNGTTDVVHMPTLIAGGRIFTWVSMGESHACAVAADGTVYCWGTNEDDQLGNGSNAAGWSVPVWKP